MDANGLFPWPSCPFVVVLFLQYEMASKTKKAPNFRDTSIDRTNESDVSQQII